MFYQLKDRLRRRHFAHACSGVLRAPPVRIDPQADLVLLSQLQHKDVLLFLLAIKSFAHRVPLRAVYVLDDGTLSAADRAALARHVPALTFLDLADYRSPRCPTGGTWERLLAISEFVKHHYVVQLDSDTLTLGPVEEVRECVAGQTAFALGTWDRQRLETMKERCATAQSLLGKGDTHVQLVAEAHFDRLERFALLRYVRGCSGFAGFPRGSFERAFVEEISTQMQAALGEKWSEWGSEQVMSNIVLANVPNASVLPHPKYADCHKMKAGKTEFIHFIGGCRFDGEHYARLGAQVIASL